MSFDAILSVPEGADGRALLAGRLGGMPALTRQLRLLARTGANRVLVTCPGDADRMLLNAALSHRLSPRGLPIEVRKAGDLPRDLADEVMLLPASNVLDHKCFAARRTIVDSAGRVLLWHGPRDALGAMSIQGAEALPPGWLAVTGDLANASATLWDSCRKGIDGIVSTHLNRPVSLAISRTIVDSPLTPNHVTILSIIVGLLGALAVLQGGYWPMLAGALLLQAASILDGVDGELARMRVQFSLLGEWLDTVGDDIVNIAFIAALGVALLEAEPRGIWPVLAFYSAAAMTLIAGIYYRWIASKGRGDILSVEWFAAAPANAGLREKLLAFGAKVFRRDMLIFMMLVAAPFGVLRWALIPISLAATATLAMQLAKMAGAGR